MHRTLPHVRIFPIALLIAQYLFLSQQFDLHVLVTHDRPWAFLGRAGDAAAAVLIAGLAGVACLVTHAARTKGTRLPGEASNARPPLNPWAIGAFSLTAYAGGYWLSRSVLTTEPPLAATFVVWLALLSSWIAAGLAWSLPSLLELVRTRANWGFVLLVVGLALALILASDAARQLWDYQSVVVLSAVVGLLQLVGEEPRIVPPQDLWLGEFGVNVAPVCSGLEGLGLMAVFVSGYLWLNRKRFTLLAGASLALGALLTVWCTNLLRIAALTWIGAYISADWALGAFHSKAGWVLFSAMALAVIALAERFLASHGAATDVRLNHEPAADAVIAGSKGAPSDDNALQLPFAQLADGGGLAPTAQALLPLFAVSVGGLLTGLFFEPVDPLYGFRIVLGGSALTWIGFRWRQLRAGVTWLSVGTGLAVLGLWLLLATPSDKNAANATAQFLSESAALGAVTWVALRALGACVVIPIAEELAFRGYFLRVLTRARFESVSYQQTTLLAGLGSSLAFGALHASWFAGSLAGLAYAGVARWRGRIEEAIVAHAVTNLGLSIIVLATGDFTHWT